MRIWSTAACRRTILRLLVSILGRSPTANVFVGRDLGSFLPALITRICSHGLEQPPFS
jgi:hypothetical protein